jgi:hypothetical protein
LLQIDCLNLKPLRNIKLLVLFKKDSTKLKCILSTTLLILTVFNISFRIVLIYLNEAINSICPLNLDNLYLEYP